MTLPAENVLQAFHWEPQPAAWRFINAIVADFLAACPEAAALAKRMSNETGTRFVDWIDHIRLPRRDPRVHEFKQAGYQADREGKGYAVFLNDHGKFPAVIVWDGKFEIGIKVEFVADFLAANQLMRTVSGGPLADLRTCEIFAGATYAMKIVERHGSRALEANEDSATKHGILRLAHLEKLRSRPRDLDSDEEGFAAAEALIDAAIRDLGRDLACDIWFAAEREFWQRRNHAARVQKARRIASAWAGRITIITRIAPRARILRGWCAVWEKLGFVCRERFYAGREAGWGAQVMEQPVTGIVTFNDVDLTPDELMGDFSHDGLAERNSLGTVGLWCGLHGDSIPASRHASPRSDVRFRCAAEAT